jgi:nucleoside-diphosphate-sugar epimerase
MNSIKILKTISSRINFEAMKILIIGGTRNVGHFLTLDLLQAGHEVTVFNRGKTSDELPANVERAHGDRSDSASLAKALAGRSFDAVVDMALYNGRDAENIIQLLEERVGRYIFVSTGQVYLVHQKTERPFREDSLQKPIIPAPLSNPRDYEEWLYGVEKSQAENVLMQAWEDRGFPVTILRLPMVNSERDHFHRVYNYLVRLQDGGPILLPQGKHLYLRHVYRADVLQAIQKTMQMESAKGKVYNISQDETSSIEDFLTLLAKIAGYKLQLTYLPRDLLDELHLLPDCSPFSDPWVSELDNQRSKIDLGMQYTPLSIYLEKLFDYYSNPQLSLPEGYQRRNEEIRLAQESKP